MEYSLQNFKQTALNMRNDLIMQRIQRKYFNTLKCLTLCSEYKCANLVIVKLTDYDRVHKLCTNCLDDRDDICTAGLRNGICSCCGTITSFDTDDCG